MMNATPRIDVLLATYRPDARNLEAQIESVRAQRGVDVNVVVGEDSEGAGPSANFSRLLTSSAAPYAAFSDQDDVWEPDKLSSLMAKMREMENEFGKDVPLLVFCDAALVDSQGDAIKGGTFIERQGVDAVSGLRFPRLLMQNFIAGNLMLLNAALREKAGTVPAAALMHDSWIALVAAAFGKIGFVDRPLVKYRQHGSNVVGATMSSSAKQFSRAAEGSDAFRERLGLNIAQAQAFVDRFGVSAPRAARDLAAFRSMNWLSRRRAIVRDKLWKHGVFRNLALLAFA